MQIFILGGTGRTGAWTVHEALKRGHRVHAVVRDKQKIKIKDSNLLIFEGSPLDMDVLQKASLGCDAILSTLNISRASDFPWSRIISPRTLLSDVMKGLIQVSRRQDLRRLVICSAWGVHETRSDLPGWFRWFIDNSNIGVGYMDHETQETLVKATDLDWTIVRPVGLTNSETEMGIQVSMNNHPRPRLTISRRSVAIFMVEAIEKNLYVRQTPVISNKR